MLFIILMQFFSKEQDPLTMLMLCVQQDAILMHELFVNVSLALVGIIMVNMIMLSSPLGVLVMVTAVLLVELGLLAIMWVAEIALSSLTLLLIIMALGLGIDYPVHVLHRLLTVEHTSAREQAHKALVSVGPAVTIGFITTVSGILLLGGSQSMLFHTVFIMLVSTVCLAYVVSPLLQYISVISGGALNFSCCNAVLSIISISKNALCMLGWNSLCPICNGGYQTVISH